MTDELKQPRDLIPPAIARAQDSADAKLAAVRVAFDALSKALSLPDGPSLAIQRHNPSWEAWKRLCDAFAAAPARDFADHGT